MDPAPRQGSPSIDELLETLAGVDESLRAIYLQLADDPDRASELESQRTELHTRRLQLAQLVGLAALAQRRGPIATPALVEDRASDPVPPASGLVTTDAEASAIEGAPPSTPAAQPATDAELQHWKESVRATGLGVRLPPVPSESTSWALVLHELLQIVGAPRSLEAAVAAIEEVEALDAVGGDAHRKLWARLPKQVQQLWLSMLVARTRALRECPTVTTRVQEQAKIVVSRYPPWAKAHVPGHVNGLQLRHEPLHGSWAEDGRIHWQALGQLLGEEATPHTRPAGRSRPTRPQHLDDDPDLDPAWPILAIVRGRRALIVGGDPREPNRERLQRLLGLDALDWPPIDGPRKVASLAERVRKGTYDLVLILVPFIAHAESEPIVEAAKSAGAAFALADGYGVAAVRLALERFLGGSRQGDVPASAPALTSRANLAPVAKSGR